MARTGRPPKEINKQTFEGLCAIQCTESEMCSVLGVCEDTLNAWCKRTYKMTFSDTYKSKSEVGRSSLRRSQFKLAEKSAAMSIWLGKQYLAQRDEPAETVTNQYSHFSIPVRSIGRAFVDIDRQIVPNKSYIFEGGRGGLKSSYPDV